MMTTSKSFKQNTSFISQEQICSTFKLWLLFFFLFGFQWWQEKCSSIEIEKKWKFLHDWTSTCNILSILNFVIKQYISSHCTQNSSGYFHCWIQIHAELNEFLSLTDDESTVVKNWLYVGNQQIVTECCWMKTLRIYKLHPFTNTVRQTQI